MFVFFWKRHPKYNSYKGGYGVEHKEGGGAEWDPDPQPFIHPLTVYIIHSHSFIAELGQLGGGRDIGKILTRREGRRGAHGRYPLTPAEAARFRQKIVALPNPLYDVASLEALQCLTWPATSLSNVEQLPTCLANPSPPSISCLPLDRMNEWIN